MGETLLGAGWWLEGQDPKARVDEALRRIEAARRGRLDELDLGGLGLTEIPWEVMELSWLRRLYLGLGARRRAKAGLWGRPTPDMDRNALRSVPSALFWALPDLEQLDLSHNEIKALPSQIGRLGALRALWLGGNQLTGLPKEIGDLGALQELWLEHNRMASLPPEIGGLKSLQGLSLTGNRLTAAPSVIGSLPELRGLRLDHNRMTSLPPEIDRLRLLQGLWLGGNLLGELPVEIGGLKALQGLWAPNNCLWRLPHQIGHLADLRELALDGNRIEALPSEIGRLRNLSQLRLDSNLLGAIPGEIGELRSLRDLWLHNNRISALPAEIAGLEGLQRLWLQNNQLRALPLGFGALAGLRELRLDDNKLAALPCEIAQLSALTRLSLDHNRLDELPTRMGWMAKLEDLTLDGNPLSSPPPDVVHQGASAVLAYLRDLDADGAPFYEAKIILVGESGAGKSTLVRRFLYDQFSSPAPTAGLELSEKLVAHPGETGAVIRFNFWDFGGREDYRPAQQRFFTRDAVYLLVWKARGGEAPSSQPGPDSGTFDAWMRILRRRAGPGVKIFAVVTGAGPDFDECDRAVREARRFCRAYGGAVIDCFAVDNETGQGVPELWRAIRREAAKLDEFGARRPKAWLRARDAVIARGAKAQMGLLQMREFNEIAVQHGVAPDAVEAFAAMLAEQGRIACNLSGGEQTDLAVMDPGRLMKAIAYVLTDEGCKAEGGALSRERMAAVWRDHGRPAREKPIRYEEAQWGHLLRLMAQHGAVCRAAGGEWLAPALIWRDRPGEAGWGDRAPLRLECRLDEPLPGLFGLLLARNHSYLGDPHRDCWRGGALLRDRRFAAEALLSVEADARVSIAVRGTFASSLMRRLTGSLEQLIGELWPGAGSAERKPYRWFARCPSEGCEGRFDLEALATDLAEGERRARCDNGRRRCRHSIASLLKGMPGCANSKAGQALALWRQDSKTLSLDEVRGALDELLSCAPADTPPRLYSLSPAEPDHWEPSRLTSQRVEITIWCEELYRPIKGASAVIALTPAWVRRLRDYGAGLNELLAAAALIGAPLDQGAGPRSGEFGAALDSTARVIEAALQFGGDAVEGAGGSGTDWLDCSSAEAAGGFLSGRNVPPSMAETLRRSAWNGGMTLVRMDGDRRLRWVSREAARSNDLYGVEELAGAFPCVTN